MSTSCTTEKYQEYVGFVCEYLTNLNWVACVMKVTERMTCLFEITDQTGFTHLSTQTKNHKFVHGWINAMNIFTLLWFDDSWAHYCGRLWKVWTMWNSGTESTDVGWLRNSWSHRRFLIWINFSTNKQIETLTKTVWRRTAYYVERRCMRNCSLLRLCKAIILSLM